MRSVVLVGAMVGAIALARATPLPAAASVAPGDAAGHPEIPPSSVEIVRLWTSYRDAESFLRLGELPTEDREPGDAIVLRSKPDAREGFYFTVRVNGKPVPDGKAVLHVIAPDAVDPQSFTFPFTAETRRSVLLLIGLTGADWSHGDSMPLAWKLEIVDATGQVVAREQSFLWSKS